MGTLVHGLDVSSYQPRDLSALIATHDVEHVVVKCYLPQESPPEAHSIAQIASALENGCTVAGYFWLYQSLPAGQQARDALALIRSCGVEPPVLWIDLEPYTDNTVPSVGQVQEAVAAIEAEGARPGIYTGAWCWPRFGHTTAFAHLPLWAAVYAGGRTLDIPLFGGWNQALGHQYTSTPVDLNVFDESVTGAGEAPTEEPEAPIIDELTWSRVSLGYLSGDFASAVEQEANRKGGPRKGMVQGFAEQLRHYGS